MGDALEDGSAGDVDCGVIGSQYARYRVPEPAIARALDHALGPARTVCNVGAGAGSYEPTGRRVVAVAWRDCPSLRSPRQRAEGADRWPVASR